MAVLAALAVLAAFLVLIGGILTVAYLLLSIYEKCTQGQIMLVTIIVRNPLSDRGLEVVRGDLFPISLSAKAYDQF